MPSILVLDDDFQARNSLAKHLEDEDFLVREAEDSESALALLEKQSVALVVVDLRLPGKDGFSFIKEAHQRWPDMKFIIHTGSLNFSIPAAFSNIAALSGSLFQKPLLDFNELTDEIRRMLAL